MVLVTRPRAERLENRYSIPGWSSFLSSPSSPDQLCAAGTEFKLYLHFPIRLYVVMLK